MRGIDKRVQTVRYLAICFIAIVGFATIVGSGGGSGDIIPPFTMTDSIAVADLNGDALTDIVTANRYIAGPPPHPGHLSVIFQDSTTPGNFYHNANYAIGSDPQSVAVGDLNNDGHTDLVGANYYDATISVLLQDTAVPGTFLPAFELPSGAYPQGIAIEDLNSDNLNDIAVAGNYISLLFNDPANPGSFYTSGTVNVTVTSIAIADIDGDGRLDIAATSCDPQVVRIILQDALPTPPGQFSTITNYSAGYQPFDIDIADLDNDNRNDLAIANLGTPDNPTTASLSVLIQQHAPEPAGLFQSAQQYKTDSRSNAVMIGDLNNDNRPDIAVSNSGRLGSDYITSGSVSVLLQTMTAGTFSPAYNYQVDSQQLDVAIADLNGDGLNDIAIADSDGARIRFQDDGSVGSFTTTILIPN